MKKAIMILGAIAVVLLMVSSVTAVNISQIRNGPKSKITIQDTDDDDGILVDRATGYFKIKINIDTKGTRIYPCIAPSTFKPYRFDEGLHLCSTLRIGFEGGAGVDIAQYGLLRDYSGREHDIVAFNAFYFVSDVELEDWDGTEWVKQCVYIELVGFSPFIKINHY